jgi:hypothetical protein
MGHYGAKKSLLFPLGATNDNAPRGDGALCAQTAGWRGQPQARLSPMVMSFSMFLIQPL